jgi:hypothetical protein
VHREIVVAVVVAALTAVGVVVVVVAVVIVVETWFREWISGFEKCRFNLKSY